MKLMVRGVNITDKRTSYELKEKNIKRKNLEKYQERREDSKESTKAKNNRVANTLIEHCFAFKETALPHTAPTPISRDMVILSREIERWTLQRRGSH